MMCIQIHSSVLLKCTVLNLNKLRNLVSIMLMLIHPITINNRSICIFARCLVLRIFPSLVFLILLLLLILHRRRFTQQQYLPAPDQLATGKRPKKKNKNKERIIQFSHEYFW
uniref:Uncharacterized protein n=1 Tax=Rhizophora mucronata TaxID=61149 RepID=A0A2P2M323_RHIMU